MTIILLTLFNLVFVVHSLKSKYGISERYNYFTAKQDIRNNNIQLITYGLFDDNWIIIRKISNIYGYHLINLGCVQSGTGHNYYNAVIEEYLNEKHGENWRIEYNNCLDIAIERFQPFIKDNAYGYEELESIADSIANDVKIKRQ